MILIDEIGVEQKIGKEYFDCDLQACKGACCTFYGDFGAPLSEEEIEIIRKNLEIIRENMPERSKKILDQFGFYENSANHYTTVCINKRDCVFVYYEGDIAFCTIEKTFHEGKINFRKPLSCHLFPIRVSNVAEGEFIYYERIDECKPGRLKGAKQNVLLSESLKESLIRKFGKNWYEKLRKFYSD